MAESEIFIPGPLNEKERAELLELADELRSRKVWIDILMYARAWAAPRRKRKPGTKGRTLAEKIRDERLGAHYRGILDALEEIKCLAPEACSPDEIRKALVRHTWGKSSFEASHFVALASSTDLVDAVFQYQTGPQDRTKTPLRKRAAAIATGAKTPARGWAIAEAARKRRTS